MCPGGRAAATRYKGSAGVESQEDLVRRMAATQAVPGVAEYIGCFHEGQLVSFLKTISRTTPSSGTSFVMIPPSLTNTPGTPLRTGC